MFRCEGELGRRAAVQLTFDGQPVAAFEEETLAATLLAAGDWGFRRSARRGEPRRLFCGMGVCFGSGLPGAPRGQRPPRTRLLDRLMWTSTFLTEHLR